MKSFEMTVEIERPPEEVFAFLSDLGKRSTGGRGRFSGCVGEDLCGFFVCLKAESKVCLRADEIRGVGD